ncbi:MAG: hypothetical protein ACOC2C_05335 [Cyclonatronaceae bacterium]
MWQSLKNRLLYGWTARRGFGLVLGLFFLGQAVVFKEIPAGFFAAIFLTQSLGNVGCFGSGCCAPSLDAGAGKKSQEISYTEVGK